MKFKGGFYFNGLADEITNASIRENADKPMTKCEREEAERDCKATANAVINKFKTDNGYIFAEIDTDKETITVLKKDQL